jgi:hypothetical protein
MPNQKSTIVKCLKEAISNFDPNTTDEGDIAHLERITAELCKVGFGSHANMHDKIEALKFMSEVLRADIADGMGITQMEELIIERGAVGFEWKGESSIEIRGRSRVACLFEGKLYLIGKVVQFKHTPETHIIEDQLTGELYEWQLSECRHLTLSEYVAWVGHMNTSRQPGLALPLGHLKALEGLH